MENINGYLLIIVALLTFYFIFMLYIKSTSKFTPVGIPATNVLPQQITTNLEPNVYETEDTRMQSPLLPPVNPMVRGATVQSTSFANPDLYNSQTYETSDYLLDNPPTNGTNQLVYSGGDTQLINIPLQYNYPYNEQLRTQQVLITPYNKIKYGVC